MAFLILLMMCQSAFSQNWQLVWQDEFNYTGAPDASKWGYDVGAGGWGNGEAQYYTNNRRENARVENGNLILEARRDWSGAEYSSCRLVSRGKGDWLYGRIEIRAKIPVGQGLWPAIWMLPTDWAYGGWPASGEIDIMESFALGGLKYDKVEANIHTQAYNHTIGTNKGAGITGLSNIEQNYHVYRVTWTANKMVFDVDGREYFTFNKENSWQQWPFDKRFHLIMNIAVGGSLGTWIDPNIFPKRMEVDYVRVYQDNGVPPINPTTGLVTVYKDCNYSGFSGGLEIGDYNLAKLRTLGVQDDDISSLRITQGYQAILYQDDNFTGASTVINSDNTCLNTTWNDKVTSIRVIPNGDKNLGGVYMLQNRHSGLNMDVWGGSSANGSNIAQANPSNTNINQQFTFTHLGDGLYRIIANVSGKSLDINSHSKADGANVEQYTYNATGNQKFILVPTGGGYHKIIASHSGKLVEVAGFSTVSGGNVQQWANVNQNSGQWKVVPVVVAPPQPGNGDGLTGNYFNGMNFETPVYSRKDAAINFNWGNGSPNAAVNADQFSARWTGQIQPMYSGEYTFYINSDNGRRLWINGQLVIDKWIDDWNVDYTGKITLVANQKYNIKIEYFENYGGAGIKFEWSSASQTRQVVPTSQLYSNPLPTVGITSPAANASFMAPASLALSASASDNGGSVAKVEYYNGLAKIGEASASPYNVNWTNVAAGSYTLTARATDNLGAVRVSAPVTVTVAVNPNNQPPVVSLTAPSNNASYNAPASITISANASDADGSVAKVEFFNGTQKLGEHATAPYSYTWANVPAGTYSLSAKAYDNRNAVTSTGTVTVTVRTVVTDACSGLPNYVENGGYVAGSRVKNAGRQYACKEWPYSGWCNGAAWAYGPGIGAYWQDAWYDRGSCTARIGEENTVNMVEAVSIAPNPATDFITIQSAEATTVTIFNGQGIQVLPSYKVAAQGQVDISNLAAGMYIVKIENGQEVVTRMIVKK